MAADRGYFVVALEDISEHRLRPPIFTALHFSGGPASLEADLGLPRCRGLIPTRRSLHAWDAKGFGKVRVFVPPSLREGQDPRGQGGVDATVTITKEGVLKVSWGYNLAVEYYRAPRVD